MLTACPCEVRTPVTAAVIEGAGAPIPGARVGPRHFRGKHRRADAVRRYVARAAGDRVGAVQRRRMGEVEAGDGDVIREGEIRASRERRELYGGDARADGAPG